MATSLSKPGLKTSIAEALYNEIITNSNNYYYYIGKTLDWVGGDVAVVPPTSLNYELDTRRDMVFMKKVTTADVAFILNRRNWISGTVYDMYDTHVGDTVDVESTWSGSSVFGTFDLSQIGVGYAVSGTGIASNTFVSAITESTVTLSGPVVEAGSGTITFTCVSHSGATSLEDSTFYVVTADNHVYKCLYNNEGSPSTVKPYAITHTSITTSDGYVWKYMYTIPNFLVNKFMSQTDMPVTTAVSSNYYSSGALNSFNIINYGVNYGPGDSLVVTGDGSLRDNVYKIITATIDDAGEGYTSTPTLVVDDPFTSVPFATSTDYITGQYVKQDSRIYLVSVGGQSGLTVPTHTSDQASNGSTTLRFVGRSAVPTVTMSAGAIASVTLDGSIGYINLTEVGSGYDTNNPPTVVISGDGINAQAVATVDYQGYISNIKVTNAGTGYTAATVTIDAPVAPSIVFDPTTVPGDVDYTENTIASVGHSFFTGLRVIYSNGGNTSVGGLINSSIYYVYVVDEDTIKLTSTYADAMFGTSFVDLAVGSTGTTHTLIADYTTATASAEIYYGYGYQTIPTITVEDPVVPDHLYASGTVVLFGQYIQSGNLFYYVSVGGILGESAPSHLSGSATNGTATLDFAGRTAQISLFADRTQAKIAPVIVDGQIRGVVVQDPGVGYTTATVTPFSISGGTEAVIEVNTSYGDLNSRQANVELLAIPGTIDAITTINSGQNYTWANIEVEGDGTGCTAEAVLNLGTIEKIIVTNPGFGYTRATVTITGNAGAVQAYARPNISPYDGHGRNAIKELYARDIGISSTIANDRVQGFLIDNEFRQLGIVKNPLAFDSNLRYTSITGSTCFSITGEFDLPNLVTDQVMTRQSDGAEFRIIALPESGSGEVSILVVALGGKYPEVADVLLYNETQQAILTVVVDPKINKYSGDILFIDNRASFQPTDEQTVSIKTVIRF